MISIPTSAGTGSEVTPFAVITDEKTGIKYPLADYELTPDIAIVDAELMMNMPRGLTAASGIDALIHAIEAYVSVLASEYTNGMALEAMYHIAHGVANGLLINEVITFNPVDNPRKQTAFPQYKYPNAKWRYTKIADYLQLGGNTEEEKIELLIKAIDELKSKVELPRTISEAGVSKEKFYATLDEMTDEAFDHQCTGANPRYPLISEIKQMYINVFDGKDEKNLDKNK